MAILKQKYHMQVYKLQDIVKSG